MEKTFFILKKELRDDEITALDDDETKRLMIELVKKRKDFAMLERGDTMVRLINNGKMIEVRKISKASFFEIKEDL